MVVFIFLAILVLIGIAWFILKPYVIKHDTIVLYTGGNGSGKSFFSSLDALRLLRRNRIKTNFHNFLEYLKFWKKKDDKDIWEKPLMFSTIPIKISRLEWCSALTVEHLMLQEKLPLRSIVFIDEINLVVSQMDYNLKGEKALNEFVTLFRHYTKGGYLVLNTQNLSKVHWVFRYCCNEAINLSEFSKPILGLPILAWAKVRKVTLGDDIKSVETEDPHNSKSNLFALFPFHKVYDTYCFSERAVNLPNCDIFDYMAYKVNKFTTIDKNKPYVSKTDKE